MTKSADIDSALTLLEFYQSAGVDAALSDMPIDWLTRGPVGSPGADFTWPANKGRARSAPIPTEVAGPTAQAHSLVARAPVVSPPATATIQKSRPQTPLAASEAETEARRIARAAQTLEELGTALQKFDGCSLKATATKLCFYRGAPQAQIMLIGEAPGRDEDLEGKPFVGRAGQLLDRMLGAIGLAENDVHITNVVYWRPPGNRTPTPQEALACRPFLDRQIELVDPDIIVVAGGAAAKEILGAADGIMRLRGKWRDLVVSGKSRACFAILHPAYLLRTPAAKQLAWLDLLAIKTRLAQSKSINS